MEEIDSLLTEKEKIELKREEAELEKENQEDLSDRLLGEICKLEMFSSFLDSKLVKIDDDEVYGASLVVKNIGENLNKLRFEIFGD